MFLNATRDHLLLSKTTSDWYSKEHFEHNVHDGLRDNIINRLSISSIHSYIFHTYMHFFARQMPDDTLLKVNCGCFDIPEWNPIRIFNCLSGKCCTLKLFTSFRIACDILAISITCWSPFLIGRPDTTMYASPMVSTYNENTKCKKIPQTRHSYKKWV